jgi:hypothetical protein
VRGYTNKIDPNPLMTLNSARFGVSSSITTMSPTLKPDWSPTCIRRPPTFTFAASLVESTVVVGEEAANVCVAEVLGSVVVAVVSATVAVMRDVAAVVLDTVAVVSEAVELLNVAGVDVAVAEIELKVNVCVDVTVTLM